MNFIAPTQEVKLLMQQAETFWSTQSVAAIFLYL